MAMKFVIMSCAFVACLALPQQGANMPTPLPGTTPAPVYCGEAPNAILQCLDNPKVIDREFIIKCGDRLSECDKMKCTFRAAGWALPGDKVNKAKVAEYFTTYATEHPEWAGAVTHLKAACLDKDLPAQGAIQDCPAYDKATPSQWKTTPECAYPRSFAMACPVCPTSCFATQVPYGTCNACAALPRTP